MIVADTNVLSELMRIAPDPGVVSWFESISAPEFFATSVTEAEVRTGLRSLPRGRRRRRLTESAERLFGHFTPERILAFDRRAAAAFARIFVHRQQAGRPIGVADCQIAAIASVHGAVVATRNLRDFSDTGVELVNPWRRGGGGGALPVT